MKPASARLKPHEIQARSRQARLRYWYKWARKNKAPKESARKVAHALERKMQYGEAPRLEDQWRVFWWYL
jgi:hypothetical protein